MSGHGGFSPIGNNAPDYGGYNNINNIDNNLPTSGVGAKPLSLDDLDRMKSSAKEQQATMSPREARSKELVGKLDILLARAAENATKGVDAKAVKTALAGLKRLNSKDRDTLSKLADTADKAFKALNAFTGRDLGKAAIKAADGKFDFDLGEDNPAGKAIQAALDAQDELADKLTQVLNQIPQSSPAFDTIDEAIMQCSHRSCEIQTLVCEFADILENDGRLDPKVAERLDTTLEKLIPRQALKMHGNVAAIDMMRTKLAPLADRLDLLAAGKVNSSLDSEELAALGREISQMSSALNAALDSGRALGKDIEVNKSFAGVTGDTQTISTTVKGGIGIDRTLLSAAREILDSVKSRLDNARSAVAKSSMTNFISRVIDTPMPQIVAPKFMPILKACAPILASAVEKRQAVAQAARRYCEEPTEENKRSLRSAGRACLDYDNEMVTSIVSELLSRSREELEADLKATISQNKSKELKKACTSALVKEFCDAVRSFVQTADPSGNGNFMHASQQLTDILSKNGHMDTQTEHLILMGDSVARMKDGDFLTNTSVRAAFEGDLRFSTLVEARIHGLKDGDINPALDDSRMTGSRPLGSGSINTVFEVSYKDGSSYVFKPEAAGRLEFNDMLLAMDTSPVQMIAQLNMATQDAANALGLEDVIAKTSVGSHNGQFGIFMEKVPGNDAVTFTDKNAKGISADHLSADEVRNLPDPQYKQAVGGIMRQLNRLQWLDIVTGQGDRHMANYFLAVDANTKNVSIKGIDNDAGFPEYRTGVRKFHLKGEYVRLFDNKLRSIAEMLYNDAQDRADEVNHMYSDPGVQKQPDGSLIVDAELFQAPELHSCLRSAVGVQGSYVPEWIDEDVYNHLMALDGDTEARRQYIDGLGSHLTQDAKDAAVSRLDDTIRLAKQLKGKGRVVSGNDWTDPARQREIAGKFRRDETSKDLGIPGKPPTAYIYKAAVIEKESYYGRMDIFRRDIIGSIAKPGWFDEEM